MKSPQPQKEPEPIQQNDDQELDLVEEASLESFPASDPPGCIGRERGTKRRMQLEPNCVANGAGAWMIFKSIIFSSGADWQMTQRKI